MKKAFDHVGHRAAFKAMKLQGVSLFSMALIAPKHGKAMGVSGSMLSFRSVVTDTMMHKRRHALRKDFTKAELGLLAAHTVEQDDHSRREEAARTD